MIFPPFLARKDNAHRFTLSDNSSRGTLSFPNFVFYQVLLENLAARLDPNFRHSRHIDFLG